MYNRLRSIQDDHGCSFTHLSFRWVTLIALFLLQSVAIHAAPFERLIMPGPVIEGHVKYENRCDECHDSFNEGGQTDRCRACHEKVSDDIKKERGYHGREPTISKIACKDCHTEHKGRSVDVIKLNKSLFKHEFTDFKLKGSHKRVACKDCHEEDKKYRETPVKCVKCHEKRSPHDDQFKDKACSDCHNATAWLDTDFDHEETGFKLEFKHKKANCKVCHPTYKYRKNPRTCVSCHWIDDSHKKIFGPKCEACHSSEKWNKAKFKHNKKTKFKITGKHKKVLCNQCHEEQSATQKPEISCISCHQKFDIHKGKMGEACETCHTPDGWSRQDFDHEKDAEYNLVGKHEKALCLSCHKSIDEKKRGQRRTCIDCHQLDDAHEATQGRQCEECHNPQGWNIKVFFEHDITAFPLIGQHAVVPCEECHLDAEYKRTIKRCDVCHAKSDEHEGSLGKECQICHTPNDWAIWKYDHNEQSEFKLEGAHEGLPCIDCHRERVEEKINLSKNCGGCHRQDDAHDGAFSNSCDRCHTTEKFSQIKVNLN